MYETRCCGVEINSSDPKMYKYHKNIFICPKCKKQTIPWRKIDLDTFFVNKGQEVEDY